MGRSSDSPPLCVFPDTADGRREAMRLFPTHEAFLDAAVAFCREYRPSSGSLSERVCSRRDPRELDGHNWCSNCPAGFMHERMAGVM